MAFNPKAIVKFLFEKGDKMGATWTCPECGGEVLGSDCKYCSRLSQIDIESLQFMGFNYRQLMDAVAFARNHGWEPKG